MPIQLLRVKRLSLSLKQYGVVFKEVVGAWKGYRDELEGL